MSGWGNNKAARRAYERRWRARKRTDKAWCEKQRRYKKKSSDKTRATARRLIEASHRNERRWRWREWERARQSEQENSLFMEAGLYVVRGSPDRNPFFVVIGKDGKKRREFLFEPLPTWSKAKTSKRAKIWRPIGTINRIEAA